MENFLTPKLGPSTTEQIGECLEYLDGCVTKTGPGRWLLVRSRENKAVATVAVDRDWLVVERALPGCKIIQLPRLMRRTRCLLDPQLWLPSGARAVLPVGEGEVRIRAERPILQTLRDEPAVLARWIATACTDAATCAGSKQIRNLAPEGAEKTGEPPGMTQQDITQLCEAAGLPVTVRSTSGEVSIALPTRDGGTCHAMATSKDGAVRFQLELGVVGNTETTPACRAAVVVALLRSAGSLRQVRSTAACDDGRIAAAFEAYVQPPVSHETLNHALAGLALAHQQVAPELDALASDDSLANAYLAVQGAR